MGQNGDFVWEEWLFGDLPKQVATNDPFLLGVVATSSTKCAYHIVDTASELTDVVRVHGREHGHA